MTNQPDKQCKNASISITNSECMSCPYLVNMKLKLTKYWKQCVFIFGWLPRSKYRGLCW